MENNFLTISNSRSGSSWLVTALGQLNDVYTDYEVKIPPLKYKKQDLHYLIEDDFKDTFFNTISKDGIIGSKMVLDIVSHTQEHLDYLLAKIPKNIKFIFLKRSLIDQVISEYKIGVINKSTAKINGKLGEKLAEISKEEHPTKKLDINSLEKYYRNLQTRLHNDLFINNFLKVGDYDFITVEYENLESDFDRIKSFINSKDDRTLKDVTVTEKLNSSHSEIEKLLKKNYSPFDTLRNEFLSMDNPIDIKFINSMAKFN